jgi:hypothetical protein
VQPTDDVLEAFVGRVLVRAEELYGRGSPRVAQVKEQIGAYLDMTYGDGANDVEEEQRPPAAAA